MSRDPTLGFASARANALTVRCTYCGADPGVECWNPRTGVVLEKQPAHYRRLMDARVA